MTSQPRETAVVGPYTLLTPLGEGGMGVVHLARHTDGRRVALKLLRPHVVGDEEARRRLAREVSSLERVRSRWIAEIIDADPWAAIPYVATRYVPGLSLHDHVYTEGPIEDADLLWFAAGLAEGVASVHAAGVLHRDVKPSNVLMEGRAPILIDFGLARVADDPKLTHTGWLLGTPGYLAPEILYGDDATAASDVHSWAATVAFAGLGRAPFGGGPAMAIMDRVRRGQVDLHGLPRPLADVVAASLAPEPLDRPPLADILTWLRPQTTRPGPMLMPPPVAPRAQPTPQPDEFTLPLALANGVELPPSVEAPTVAERPAPTRVEPTHVQPAPIQPAPVQPMAWPPPDPWGHPVDLLDEPVPTAQRLRRSALLLSLVLLGTALLDVVPWLALAGLALTTWFLRSCSLAGEALGHRRRLRGSRWYDPVLLLVHTPWRIVQAVPGTLLLLGWGLGLTAAAALLCYAAAASVGLSLVVSALVLSASLMWGPTSARVRGPILRLAGPASRTTGWWMIATGGVLLVALGLGVAAVASGTHWTPSDHRPLARTVG